MNPEIELTPSEASIWSLRGQQELKEGNLKQAESSFRPVLELGLNGEAHYSIAKCLLALNRLDDAFVLALSLLKAIPFQCTWIRVTVCWHLQGTGGWVSNSTTAALSGHDSGELSCCHAQAGLMLCVF